MPLTGHISQLDHLYWNTDLPVAEIAERLGLPANQLSLYTTPRACSAICAMPIWRSPADQAATDNDFVVAAADARAAIPMPNAGTSPAMGPNDGKNCPPTDR